LLQGNALEQASTVLDSALKADSANLRLQKLKMPIDLEKRKYSEVIKTGQRLLNEGDSSVFVLNELGKAYYLTLDYKNALRCFLMIPEELSSDREMLYYDIARSYRGMKDYKNAVSYLEKAINLGISTRAASYYGLLGDSFEQIQQNESAKKAYQRGLDFENDGSLLYNIALLHEMKMNDKKTAISYYEHYLKTIDEKKKSRQANYIKNKIAELKR
jgi:tetratricopeptide (TPR) repeat protein